MLKHSSTPGKEGGKGKGVKPRLLRVQDTLVKDETLIRKAFWEVTLSNEDQNALFDPHASCWLHQLCTHTVNGCRDLRAMPNEDSHRAAELFLNAAKQKKEPRIRESERFSASETQHRPSYTSLTYSTTGSSGGQQSIQLQKKQL